MPLLRADHGDLRILTLSNPTKRNALTLEMLAALVNALPTAAEVSGPAGPRVVLLRGDDAGGGFSAGFDIDAIDEQAARDGLDPIGPAATALEACAVPVVAAIDGPCFGGAVELALASTIRVAGPTATFCIPATRLGLVYSAGGLRRLLRAVGVGQAQRLMLSAERVDAVEAARIGLVDVLADDDGVTRGRALGAHIAGAAPLAVRGTLEALRVLAGSPLASAADHACVEGLRARSLASHDLVEGVAAARARRVPLFGGN